jgi:transcriptional regulator with XRE-family HTH domain
MSIRKIKVRNRFPMLLVEREAKEGRNIPLKEVAAAIGINANTLTRWNKPEANSLIDIEIAHALCGYFGVKLDELFEFVASTD